MKNQTDPALPNTDHFDSETLLTLRESSRVYQKLDLAYLTAAGAIVTALKLSNDAIIEISAGLTWGALVFIILLAFDTQTEQMIHKDWIESKKNSNNRTKAKYIQGFLSLQPLLHVAFIGGALMYYFGVASGISSFQKSMEARATIQTLTSLFFYKNSRAPESIEELIAFDPHAGHLYAKIDREPVSFTTEKDTMYKIIFSGPDKIFGTADDLTVDGSFQIWKFLDKAKKT